MQLSKYFNNAFLDSILYNYHTFNDSNLWQFFSLFESAQKHFSLCSVVENQMEFKRNSVMALYTLYPTPQNYKYQCPLYRQIWSLGESNMKQSLVDMT